MRRRVSNGRHQDAGETLIELMIAIAIMGITFVALLGGITTSANATIIFKDQAGVETVLASAAGILDNAAYVDCTSTSPTPLSAYEADMAAVGTTAGATARATAVQDWNGSAFQNTCYDYQADYYQSLQLITLTVTSPDGAIVKTLAVTKRP
jgi:type II secretory pathway pseudopilin PulG